MSMSKKDFIALADHIAFANRSTSPEFQFSKAQINLLSDFCAMQNPNFKRDRWLSYIKGECGPNGGTR